MGTRKHSYLRRAFLVLATLGIALIAPDALGVDTVWNVRSHGVACFAEDATKASQLAFNRYGVRNTSTTTPVKVICPTGYHGTLSNATINVWHDGATQTVTCIMTTTNLFGGSVWTKTLSAAPGDPNPMALDFKVPSGFGYATCSLPAAEGSNAAYVNSFRTFED